MLNVEIKPEKWFLQDSKLKVGKNYYDYSTANVNEKAKVTDLGEGCFYIECMDCIEVDEGSWGVKEDCSKCIFTEKCVKEEK